jgi:hypothetical protein
MPIFRLHSDWKRFRPIMVMAASGVILLAWQPKAQTQTPAQERKAARTETVPQKTPDKRTIRLGGYQLKLVDVNKDQYVQTASGSGFAKPFRSNLTFSLEITADNHEDLQLLKGVENLHGLDDRGRAVRGPEGVSYAPYISPLKEEGVRRETLALQTEDGAKSLKTLEGILRLETGIARTVTFSGEELHPDVSRQVGRVTMTIDFFKLHKDGEFRLYAVCETPRFNPPVNPLDRTRPSPFNHDRIILELIGADGVTYKAGSSGSSSSGKQPQPVPGGVDDGAPSISMITTYLDYGFRGLPEGFRLKSIVCHFVEQQGDIRSLPFKFTDIPIADKLVSKP